MELPATPLSPDHLLEEEDSPFLRDLLLGQTSKLRDPEAIQEARGRPFLTEGSCFYVGVAGEVRKPHGRLPGFKGTISKETMHRIRCSRTPEFRNKLEEMQGRD